MSKKNERISISIESASTRWFSVIGSLLMCAAVGMVSYTLAQKGWVEIAATALTTFLFQLVRLLVSNGMLDLHKTTANFTENDFAETRGALKTAIAEYQAWQARSPLWRLCMLAIGFMLAFMVCRWMVGIGLQVFSNQWVAGAAACLLGALIIAPDQISKWLASLKSEPTATPENNENKEKENDNR